MKYLLSLSILILLILISCSKSADNKYCWGLVDHNGNELESVCDKTEAELFDIAKRDYPGGFVNPSDFTTCNYYKIEGAKYCWLINNVFYKNLYTGKAMLIAHCYNNNTIPVQVDSNYCMTWYTRQAITFKPTHTVQYSGAHGHYYCGDTVKTIYQGRQIVLRDVTDTLIVLQFSSDGSHW